MICKDTLKVKIYEVASLLKVGAIVLRPKNGPNPWKKGKFNPWYAM